jgi:ribosomal protein S18 acetylase RimI-like enzyme
MSSSAGSGGTTEADPWTVVPTTLTAGGASLDCSVVPWDTRIFGFPVADIGRFSLAAATTGADATALFEAFDTWCTAHDVRLASCRLDHLQLRESMVLEANGFRFIEAVYHPRLTSVASASAAASGVTIESATLEDLPGIESIAADAFSTGRFLLDHRLPADLSRRRYADWVRSAFEGSRQDVLMARIDGEVVGFFVVEQRPDRSVYWHLTAIAPAFQGRGIGSRVWRSMVDRHAAEGAVAIETTVSGHNLAVLNLYSRLGFSLASAELTFHRLGAG